MAIKRNVTPIRQRQAPASVREELESRLFGQAHVIDEIIPYVELFQSGLSPDNRPVGVFLLLGPTGTGKTRTVEALAEAIHGSSRNILKVDCGEFQMEHEVAKLIGAPPGYLGHRETQPMLSQQKLTAVTSDKSQLSLVLFDEIEKAATSMTRILLGVLDKATLRLGDNSTVNFEKSIIFLTSNLGAKEMSAELTKFGFLRNNVADDTSNFTKIGVGAAKRRFSPEFMNRIDAMVSYQPLGEDSLRSILEDQLGRLRSHIMTRLGTHSFSLVVSEMAKQLLLKRGVSKEYGARELKRTIQKYVTTPLAHLITRRPIEPGEQVEVHVSDGEFDINVVSTTQPHRKKEYRLLLVDDNEDLRRFLTQHFEIAHFVVDATTDEGMSDYEGTTYDFVVSQGFHTSERCDEMRRMFGNAPNVSMIASESEFVPKEALVVLRKPFLMTDMLKTICSVLLKRELDEAA